MMIIMIMTMKEKTLGLFLMVNRIFRLHTMMVAIG